MTPFADTWLRLRRRRTQPLTACQSEHFSKPLSAAGLRVALESGEYPIANITFDLADGPCCVDGMHTVDRASGVYKNIVEPMPSIDSRLNPGRRPTPAESRAVEQRAMSRQLIIVFTGREVDASGR
jgi:hypothetical protein